MQAAVTANDIVVGMRQNPFPKKACKLLTTKGIKFQCSESGSYFTMGFPRLVLKMWTEWQTFPMVFVKGVLVGGYQDLARLIEKGELKA